MYVQLCFHVHYMLCDLWLCLMSYWRAETLETIPVCYLFVVCCLLFFVCCLLFVVCCLLVGDNIHFWNRHWHSKTFTFGSEYTICTNIFKETIALGSSTFEDFCIADLKIGFSDKSFQVMKILFEHWIDVVPYLFLHLKVQNITEMKFCAGLDRQKRQPSDKFSQHKIPDFVWKPGGF